MDCPRCNAVMRPRRVRNVIVHFCPDCAGLWLGRDAMAGLRRRHGDKVTALTTAGSRARKADPEGKAVCPDDSSRMVLRTHRGVTVDLCPSCGGVWLDRGELELILRPHQAELVAKGAPLPSGSDGFQVVLEFVFNGGIELAGESIGWIFEALASN